MHKKLVVLSLTIFLSCAHLSAQSTFGTVLGGVRDASGAAIASALLKLTELDENTTSTATSNEVGLYEFLNVRPGRYKITVDKAGFATASATGLRLSARD